MKETTKMSRAICQLEKIYNTLNMDFYKGELPAPIITVQSKPGTYGHCSVTKIWKKANGETYELNIAAEVLNFPIEETLDTMLHEMVHLYCREHGIQEVSRGNIYHNSRFKEEAEKRGLTCFKTQNHGWNTSPGENLVEYALEKGWNEIKIGRESHLGIRTGTGGTAANGGGTGLGGEKRPSSTRKYKCPKCGDTARTTKVKHLVCGDCMVSMEEV